MLSMNIDLSALSSISAEVQLDLSPLQRGLVEAARFVRDEWIKAVSGEDPLPGMTRSVNDDKYAAALATGESMQFPRILHAIILPVNYEDGVNAIEAGKPAYDMKPSLLSGPKSKPLKDGNGRYNTVPFRHYAPGKPGGGSSGISIRMRMPNEVYNSAKALDRSVPDPNTGKMQWGMSLDWDVNRITRKSPDPSQWEDYTHKSDIFDGMYRVGYERHTQYLTFRRVSTPRTKTITRGPNKGQTVQLGSDPNSWIHPAIPANPVVQAVYAYCMPQVDKYLQEIAQRLVESS